MSTLIKAPRIAREFKPYYKLIAFVFASGLVISAIQPASLKLSQNILDELQKGTSLSSDFFKWVPLSLVVVFFVSGLAKYFHNTTRRYVSESIIRGLRVRLYERFLSFPLSVLDSKRTGDLLSSIQNDLQAVSSGIDTFFLVLKEPFTFIGLLSVAFYYDWRLATTTLLAAPLVAFLFSKSGSAVKRYTKKNLGLFADLMSISQESIAGSRVVKVFRLEKTLSARFNKIQDLYFKTHFKSIKVEELATPLIEFIGALLMAMVIIYGGYRISNGELSSGELVAFILALGLAQMPIKQMNNAFLKIKTADAASERIYNLLDITEYESRNVGRVRKASFDSSIRFDNVSLYYGDKRALNSIELEIKKGECVAFVGHSGSGKTSLVNLLPRLYEVSEGNVFIDGKPIYDYYLDDLRKMISVVTQDTFLFHDTIYANIQYGNMDATREEIERAARQAYCYDFIQNLPHGFDTVIGERGVCLSGGERQRVAIARALLKNAPILILDEATSNLDSRSEAIVQQALEELIKGRTTLMVAHRLSTIKKADRIYVMDEGKVIESGNHEMLSNKRGLYTKFLERQSLVN